MLRAATSRRLAPLGAAPRRDMSRSVAPRTSASRTLLLPLLWQPTTATCGSSKSPVAEMPAVEKMSPSLLTKGTRLWPSATGPIAAMAAAERRTAAEICFLFEIKDCG